LNVWWYGGSESVDESSSMNQSDSCELVPVRIERTSPNSRRIFGEITINAAAKDVWTILTDYNRLSIHVPNLVESKIERPLSSGTMGDGKYQCRLYQKGAQKIIGFEFGASVTMDMKEEIVPQRLLGTLSSSSLGVPVSDERKISFKCVDSFFFREFDGTWKVQEYLNPETSLIETLLSYVVDVRPKGPVPVAALEWRIREDVPTNLRAVKRAALMIHQDDVWITKRQVVIPHNPILPAVVANTQSVSTSKSQEPRKSTSKPDQSSLAEASKASRLTALARDARGKIQWLKEETMAAYLTDSKNI
jgi:Polyketide cyclase / dehydrase and lipid transport